MGLNRLQAILDALPIAAALVHLSNGQPKMMICNSRFARLLRRTADHRHMDEIADLLRAHFGGDGHARQQHWQEPGDGERHYQVHLSAITKGSRTGVLWTMLTLSDRTAEITIERSLRFEMMHDSLTGLPNRLAFGEAVHMAIEDEKDGRGPGGFAVLSLDLTRFSRINESVGSAAGDELIISIARRLMSTIHSDEMLARLGGDEFGILVHLVDGPGDALHAARRMQEALAVPLRLPDLDIQIGCAIGCALWHEQAPSSAHLMRNAQLAMKRAKRSSRIEVYQPGEAGKAIRRFSLETELRAAIGTDQIGIAFQPLIALDSGRIVGFEALARWQHPRRGLIPPLDFIAVAEESGLVLQLGRLVLDKALGTLADWDRAAGRALPIYLSVNVSPVQLARDTVAEAVEQALSTHRIAGHRVTLELTESSIIADPVRATRVLDALKLLSCRIAMDDFGTGYSSLAYLQKLPIDILKIDRQFVGGMVANQDSSAIIRAILSLATALNMSTIAEGVETEEIARMLSVLGCHTGQGYYYARPMSADAAFAYLREGKAVRAEA